VRRIADVQAEFLAISSKSRDVTLVRASPERVVHVQNRPLVRCELASSAARAHPHHQWSGDGGTRSACATESIPEIGDDFVRHGNMGRCSCRTRAT
jgi:hypothetical protein